MKNLFFALVLTAVASTALAQRPSRPPQNKVQPYLVVTVGPEAQPLQKCEVFVNRVVINGEPKTLNVLNLSGQIERAFEASQSFTNYNVIKHIVAKEPAVTVKGIFQPNGPFAIHPFTVFVSSGDTRTLKGQDAKELLKRAKQACGSMLRP